MKKLSRLTAAAVLVGAMAVAVGPTVAAHAYGPINCDYVTDVDPARIHTSSANWGDGPYVDHNATGTAAVCWRDWSWVTVISKTFYENNLSGCAWANYRAYNSSGTRLFKTDGPKVCQRSGDTFWAERETSMTFTKSRMKRLRIALMRDIGNGPSEVGHVNVYYNP